MTLNATPFFDYVNERHWVYLRKTKGSPWPWTRDPILQEYSFCNVFRELDKVTLWIHTNWRIHNIEHPNLWIAMCLARHVNWPETLAEVGYPKRWDADHIKKILHKREKRGEKVYTGAYFTASKPGSPKYEHIPQLLDDLYRSKASSKFFKDLGARPARRAGVTLKETWEALMGYEGFGAFMAYEVVTDLRHTRYLCSAPDIMTWASVGPGSKRGLNRLHGRPLEQGMTQENGCTEMRELLELSREPGHLGLHVPKLEMRDVEHNLCEVDKWLRVKNGEGTPRCRYKSPLKGAVVKTWKS